MQPVAPPVAHSTTTGAGRQPWRRRTAFGLGAAAIVAGFAMVAGSTAMASSAGHATLLVTTAPARVQSNPSRSMRPSAAFDEYCLRAGYRAKCNTAATADINLARRSEHLRPLSLPGSFWRSSTLVQLKTIANLERTVRHLPALPRKDALNTRAEAGANTGHDPTGPARHTWTSNLSIGFETPLAADFGWMYDDGPGSPNTACSSPGGPQCWAHRDNILSPWAGTQGTGMHVNSSGQLQLAQLFVKNT